VADVLTNVGGKIPLIGGGVGAIYDGYGTHVIGQCAKSQLPTRRPAS